MKRGTSIITKRVPRIRLSQCPRGKKSVARGLLLAVCCLTLAFSSLGIRSFCQSGVSQLVNLSTQSHTDKTTAASDAAQSASPLASMNVEIGRTEEYEVSSGRLGSLEQSMVLFGKFPLMGVGKGNIVPYGDRGEALVYSETMKDWRSHEAVDFELEKGGIVRAMTDGVVTSVYDDDLLGKVVEIDHGNSLVASYCGLGNTVSVRKGDEIKVGQQIGTIGDVPSEIAEPAHLHLILTQDGQTIDAAQFLSEQP